MENKRKYSFVDKFRDQVLRCSSCGFCRAVCPVHGAILRPAYNARGKMLLMKEVMDGTVDLNEELIDTLFQCTGCASCYNSCPSGVCVPDIIKQIRKDMVLQDTCHPAFTGMHQVLNQHTNIYGQSESVNFGRKCNTKAPFIFFIGCVGTYREDDSTEAALSLLDRLDIDYTLIEEVCCSGILDDVGYEVNESLARRNIEQILATGAQTVITACPYCWRTFKTKEAYKNLREKGISIIHTTHFLSGLDFSAKTSKRVTYHDPCDLGRHCGIYEEPREIIRKIAEDFVEMPHHHEEALCCGAGGGVRGAYAKNSIKMARKRLEDAEAIKADILLTECNSCIHNFTNAKLRRQNLEIYNISQFIFKLMDES